MAQRSDLGNIREDFQKQVIAGVNTFVSYLLSCLCQALLQAWEYSSEKSRKSCPCGIYILGEYPEGSLPDEQSKKKMNNICLKDNYVQVSVV